MIVITRPIPPSAQAILSRAGSVKMIGTEIPLTSREIRSRISGATAIVSVVHDQIDATTIEAAGPTLRVVANIAVGYDNLDIAALRAHDVVATNTPGVLADATADLTFGLMLGLTRRIGEGERLIRGSREWSFELDFLTGVGLQGKTLGIVGFGEIGRAVAARATAFGMRIVYTGPRRADASVEEKTRAEYLSLPELLLSADIVSLHCPWTPRTHHLIDAEALARMGPRSYLINAARGPIVDENDLAEALQNGVIAGAALDVFEHEPTVDRRLLGLENVILTPHLGSATTETRTRMAVLAARNVAAVLTGLPPLTPIRGTFTG